MSAVLYADIGGKPVPLADCDWALWKPCGCLQAVAVACIPAAEHLVATEAAAWKQFYDRPGERKAAAAAGMRVELITHKRWISELMEPFGKPCPHAGRLTDDATFDAEVLAIIRPSWEDRGRYADASAQVAALRALADRRAASLADLALAGSRS